MHKYLVDRINVEWIVKIMELLDRNWRGIQETVEECEMDGVMLGKRRDVFNRLSDLQLLEKKKGKEPEIRLTDTGMQLKRVFMKSPGKGIDYIHLLHCIQSFNPASPRYFSTYRFTLELYMEYKPLNKEHLPLLVRKLEEHFPDSQGITGMDESSIRKSRVFAEDMEARPNRSVDLRMVAYGIQQYMAITKRSELLLSSEVLKDFSVMFFASPDETNALIERTIKMTGAFMKRYSVAGSYIHTIETIPLS
ncbi:hypothetical protein [Paenibacillus lautus]|uniref:hypothetical protein n=1 Tax=Paenibacillus lautus TaxID=1401 RepID=UPI003D9A2FAB